MDFILLRHQTGLSVFDFNYAHLETKKKNKLELSNNESSDGSISHACWDPQGSRVAVAFTDKDHQISIKVFYMGLNEELGEKIITLNAFTATPPSWHLRHLQWSPRGTYLIALRLISNSSTTAENRNVIVWKLPDMVTNSKTEISPVCGFTLRTLTTGQWPLLHWTFDERFAVLSSRTSIVIYNGTSIEMGPVTSLDIPGVVGISVAPNQHDSHSFLLAAYSPSKDGMPLGIHIVEWPGKVVTPVPTQMFGAVVDEIAMTWNYAGDRLLLLLRSAVDLAGKSYEGTGDVFIKVGPVITKINTQVAHCAEWSPTRNEFILIQGNSPSSILLFNGDGEIIFTFPSGYRNTISWSPSGDIVALAGFGNMAGDLTLWYRDPFKLFVPVSEWREPCTVLMKFSPSGAHLMTACTSPRLKVDNNMKLFDLYGTEVLRASYSELYDVQWKPNPNVVFTTPPRIDQDLVLSTLDAMKLKPINSNKSASKPRNHTAKSKAADAADKVEKSKRIDALSDWRSAKSEPKTETVAALNIQPNNRPVAINVVISSDESSLPNSASSLPNSASSLPNNELLDLFRRVDDQLDNGLWSGLTAQSSGLFGSLPKDKGDCG